MKSLSLLTFAFLAAFALFANPDQTNGLTKEVIINGTKGATHAPHMTDVMPSAFYHESNRLLTIEFPVADFEPYTLTVSSPYNSLDYYVTTPFISVNISPDVVEVDLLLETTSGDMYYGSFEATAAGSTE